MVPKRSRPFRGSNPQNTIQGDSGIQRSQRAPSVTASAKLMTLSSQRTFSDGASVPPETQQDTTGLGSRDLIVRQSFKRHLLGSGPCGSVGWSIVPYTKRSRVQSLVRAHTEVEASVLVRTSARGNPSMYLLHIDGFFFSLSPSFPLSLKINKHVLR
ncbi:hypothetical protein HJG60_012010 [Phyllostomus discolor]|uniref:Uncharacterized protein n=1 Tax=Phyllostomus discolor TaxID=89673 RepID=A0A833ZP83_9CHIR|nr:hypothetical protein HJG60_012010 [Phyllostomus discolor]